MDINGFFILAAIFGIITVFLNLIVIRLSKGKKVYKYILPIAAALASISSYIKAVYFSQAFQDIAYMLVAILCSILFIISLITVFIANIIMKKS